MLVCLAFNVVVIVKTGIMLCFFLEAVCILGEKCKLHINLSIVEKLTNQMTADMLLGTVLCMFYCCWSRVDRHKLMVLVGSWFPVNVYIFASLVPFFYIIMCAIFQTMLFIQFSAESAIEFVATKYEK